MAIVGVLVLCSVQNSASAQGGNTVELTEEEKEKFKKKTIRAVNLFQDYLSKIANANGNNLIRERRRSLISTALESFINRGEAPADCNGENRNAKGEKCGPVEMLVSSTRKGAQTDTLAIRDYLYRVSDSKRYDKVEITRAKSCYVSQFKRSGTDRYGNPIYEAVATFYQDFCGYKNDLPLYCDTTVKEMRVQLKVNSENKWEIYLGDTSVKETKRKA